MSIATAISSLQSASADIASAITAKGVTVPSGSGFGDYASLIGQISGTPAFPFTKLSYLQTNGTNYLLAPVKYSSQDVITINMRMNIVSGNANYGTGWNAGGGVFIYNSQNYGKLYGNGSSQLSPGITLNNIIDLSYTIGNGTTAYIASKGGTISTASRTNSSLATYAGNTGYPIGVTTNSGGSVPYTGVTMRLYEITILKFSELVFHGIPVISTEAVLNDQGQTVPTGTVGLYDSISGDFYTNRASGTDFTPGY